MSTEKEIRQKFGAFLSQKYWDWANEVRVKTGKIPSQTQFALKINVPQGSFSQWANGARLPDKDNQDKLAESLGPEVYRILEEPERLPVSMRPLAEIWPLLNNDQRKTLIAIAKEKAEHAAKKAAGNPQTIEA